MSTVETPSVYRLLFDKGIRYSTVIDLGCADGSFFLHLLSEGLVPDAVPFNLDANPLYEDSLRTIKEALGGDYRISAATDNEGEVELTEAAHPYWSSLRPSGDSYWKRVNNLSTKKIKVPATTLDILYATLNLKPPFLLRVDIQGAEVAALRGASALLQDTYVVSIEADVDDFQDINSILLANNFALYDITELHHVIDGRLGWFYPIYINRKIDFVRPEGFWKENRNDDVIQNQIERRKRVLAYNENIINSIKKRNIEHKNLPEHRQSTISMRRNNICYCGSGKKYKHCCGNMK